LKSARAAYERGLQLAPDHKDGLYRLAALLEKDGAHDDAERVYRGLTQKHPDLEDAWFRLGYLRLRRGDRISLIGNGREFSGLLEIADQVARQPLIVSVEVRELLCEVVNTQHHAERVVDVLGRVGGRAARGGHLRLKCAHAEPQVNFRL